MKFEGTKGEWVINKVNNVVSKHNFPIAIIYDGYTPHGSFKNEDERYRKANAKLISCAPEMLEMLIKTNELLLEDSLSVEQIKLRKEIEKIIKKATTI